MTWLTTLTYLTPLPGSFDEVVDIVDRQAVFDLVAGATASVRST